MKASGRQRRPAGARPRRGRGRCGRRVLLLMLVLVWTAGCGAGEAPVRELQLPPGTPVALVLNGLGETLSVLDLERGTVQNNVLALGAMPNHLALSPDGRTLVVTASGANRLEVIDLERFERMATIDLGPGVDPWETVIVDAQTAYVSEWLTHRVTRVDLAAGRVSRRIGVGPSPQGLAAAAGRIFVACSGYAADTTFSRPGVVSVVEGDSLLVNLTVASNPQAVLRVGDEIHVVCTGRQRRNEGRVMIIDPQLPAVIDSLEVGGSPAFAVQVEERVYLSGFFGGLLDYAWSTRTVLHGAGDPLLPIAGLFGLDWDPVGERLYLADFADDLLLAVEADTLAGAWPVGHGPQRVRIRRP